jgi:hypothetical protein
MKKGGPKKMQVLNSPRALRPGEGGYGKKRKVVFVKNPKTGRIKRITFGDRKLGLGVNSPARRRSYCARSAGQGNLKNKLSANYWARRDWKC